MSKERSIPGLFLRKRLVFTAFLVSCANVNGNYVIQDDYNISNFADTFTFFTQADPTNGFVNYVNQDDAESSGLFDVQDSSVYLRVDSSSTSNTSGRNSLRLTSVQAYNHGLVILDLAHAPGGQCGTWPAYWMLGPDWPANGEIDIIEGVNSAVVNTLTLHTGAGCSISDNGGFTAIVNTSNCDINAPGQATNQGCSMQATNESTYGVGFNNAGGGVYATEWTSQAITIWFFPRASIPTDVASGAPDPSTWGTALASFSGTCDVDQHVRDMQIVFDITFCGDWAGVEWNNDPICSQEAPTCESFVQNNPSAFSDTFWAINYLKVYVAAEASATTSIASEPAITSNTPAASTSMIENSTATFDFGLVNSLSKSYIGSWNDLARLDVWPDIP